MLSDKILEELVRNTPMSEYLIKETWPDLSTESRLQIIQASADLHHGFLPTWLSVLALNDSAPIVRYWAARLTYFKKPAPESSDDGEQKMFAFLSVSTDEEKQLYATATADPSELVRLCADGGETLSYQTLSTVTQFRRLAFLRGLSRPYLGSFFEWLDAAIDAGVPDRELGECAQEFLALPHVQEELTRNPDDFQDGMDAYSAGKDIETAWQVVKKAGVILQRRLVYVLPTRMGLTKIKADELAQMPEEVLTAFPWRSDGSEEIAAVLALMHEHPERFPEGAVKSLNRADGMLPGSDLSNARARYAVDRSQATLDTLIRLDEKVNALSEQIQTMQAEANRERGLFR
jgi:hypothetical protein